MITGTARSISKEEIKDVQEKLNAAFLAAMVEHCLNFNGGFSEESFFYSELSDIETNVDCFLPIKYENKTGCTIESAYTDFVER